MAIEILMPALSPTMTEGKLAKWLKKEGDKIKPGEVIAEIETDKATMEVEAVDSGTLGKIVVLAPKEGVKVNALIAVLLEAGESAKDFESIIAKHKNTSQANESTKEPEIAKPQQAPASKAATQHSTSSKIFASPLAKRIAGLENVNLANISGSGPNGRIVKDDVLNASKSGNSISSFGRNPIESSIIPVSPMRKVIAQRLSESKQTIPHFYLSVDCEIDLLTKVRNEINDKAPISQDKALYKISLNDFVIKACAVALAHRKEANASWSDQGIIQYNNVDISVAVAISEGLITPIVKNADQKSLSNISNEMKSLAIRAKAGQLQPSEYQGGGFTVSNLGMYAVKQFNAIINPPQACIISVGGAEKRPVVKNDKVVPATVMTITLSCDHRAIDGAVAAQLLGDIKTMLENPAMMLV